jgi:hypothetical protein
MGTISSAPAGADIQVVDLFQRQEVMRRLDRSIPEQNVRRLSANSGGKPEDLLENRVRVGSEKVNRR